MSSAKPYIGCKIGLLSKAQNRYEGILYTIDKVNSTVVLAKVKCFGTEGRPTDRPTPPKDDIYEYITFRGSDIKDITLCEDPERHGLPPDPAIVQSSSVGPSGIYPPLGSFSPLQLPAYSHLAASSLLNHQYAAALGLGPILPGFHVRKGPMVEKGVQTLRVEELRKRRVLTAPQEQDQHWEKRRPLRVRGEATTRRSIESSIRSNPAVPNSLQESSQQQNGNGPLTRRQGARRRRNRSRGLLMMAKVPSATLKFDTDFDFDYSNAQFNKELEREVQDRLNMKDGNDNTGEKQSNEAHLNTEECHFGPKCYYDKAKSFFDNISSNNKLRLTWAEERKRNLETFGVPGWFRKGQSFRGGYAGRRGRGTTLTRIPYRSSNGQL